jgi:guanyl-specific ribonuclease Sa
VEPTPRPAPRRRARFPLLAPLVVLGVLASVLLTPAPSVRHVGLSSAAKPFCVVDTDIPDEAYAVEEFVRTHNYSPPPGLKGGSPFQDIRHGLPALLRPYKEYDVHPAAPGQGRPGPRVVLSDRIPYASWYSPDHYGSFLLMFPIDCIPNVGSVGPPGPFSPWSRGGS